MKSDVTRECAGDPEFWCGYVSCAEVVRRDRDAGKSARAVRRFDLNQRAWTDRMLTRQARLPRHPVDGPSDPATIERVPKHKV